MEEFEHLIFKAKEEVYSHLQGSNLSKLLGQGYDFSELRPYEISDDIRHISWINSAKLGEPYVKKMHEERELLVQVAMLVDGRMVIGQKEALMQKVLAILGYSTLFTHNRLSLSFMLGETLENFEATKEVADFENRLKRFSQIEPLGVAMVYDELQEKLLSVQEQKSLFFVVGDFLDEVDFSILAQKHELCVVMVRDRWEENPNFSANSELVNPLTKRRLSKNGSKRALAEYRKKLEAHDAQLYAHFNAHNIKYVKLYALEEVLGKLEKLFHLH